MEAGAGNGNHEAMGVTKGRGRRCAGVCARLCVWVRACVCVVFGRPHTDVDHIQAKVVINRVRARLMRISCISGHRMASPDGERVWVVCSVSS